jgi:hypothetical protein
MRAHRLPLALALVLALAGGLLAPAPGPRAAGAAPAEVCFAETNKCLRGRFLDYWQINGGLARNGFPITGERRELLEDGNEYTVQYFERVRLEYHPENQPPYDVLLGFFGRRVERAQFGGANSAVDLFWQALAPATPLAGASYFPETGHNLGGGFRAYWTANGGLAQFGFPLTEERRERLEDGNQYTVQYFERARLEYHPENPAPYDILLGQFGRRIEREATLLTGAFGRVYLADQGVRDRLGAPAEAAAAMVGATQEFERGRMFYLSAARTTYWGGFAPVIYILAGGAQSGSLLSYVPQLEWPDTWQEGEEGGGGPAPQAGLFYPKRGFGKVWRLGSGLIVPNGQPNSDVRDRLGYATTADETGYQLSVQRFDGGLLLSTPDGRSVYAVFANRVSNGSALVATYERREVPAR